MLDDILGITKYIELLLDTFPFKTCVPIILQTLYFNENNIFSILSFCNEYFHQMQLCIFQHIMITAKYVSFLSMHRRYSNANAEHCRYAS